MSSDGRFLTVNEWGAITHTEEDFAFFCGLSGVKYIDVLHTGGVIRNYEIATHPLECVIDITDARRSVEAADKAVSDDTPQEEMIPAEDAVIGTNDGADSVATAVTEPVTAVESHGASVIACTTDEYPADPVDRAAVVLAEHEVIPPAKPIPLGGLRPLPGESGSEWRSRTFGAMPLDAKYLGIKGKREFVVYTHRFHGYNHRVFDLDGWIKSDRGMNFTLADHVQENG
jgi:hypothetical protein